MNAPMEILKESQQSTPRLQCAGNLGKNSVRLTNVFQDLPAPDNVETIGLVR